MPSNFQLDIFSDDLALARRAAEDWVELARASAPPFCVALSGGRIAKTFFLAAAERARASGAFDNVQFFWADERCVPPNDPDSNFRLANESLLKPLGIPPDRIHRLKGELDPSAAVREANGEIGAIARRNQEGMPSLDLVILGLGENAHIASLMPEAPEAVKNSRETYVRIDNSPKPPPRRISLTYAAIAAAREVWMLAAGAGKEEALRESLKAGADTPFARVLRSRSGTRIYSDIKP
jgi:6-phosphogluconolactonase